MCRTRRRSRARPRKCGRPTKPLIGKSTRTFTTSSEPSSETTGRNPTEEKQARPSPSNKTRKSMNIHLILYRGISLGAVAALTLGLGQFAQAAEKKGKNVEIRAKGSDTMI